MNIKLVETVTVDPKKPETPTEHRAEAPAGFYRGGYAEPRRWALLTISTLNKVLALILIILCLPLFFIIGITVKIIMGGPIFYRGTRLGLHKKHFFMYKFRTLPIGSQSLLGADLVSEKRIPLSPFVRLLRDTRLDELPQLFNILFGDMDFVGPRPLRPEVYESIVGTIPHIDLCFTVRPGLIGFSQLFTPHNSPKRLRAFIDNRFILLKRYFLWDFFIVFYTAGILTKAIILKSAHVFYTSIIKEKIFHVYNEKRRYTRESLTNSEASLTDVNIPINYTPSIKILDANESFCRVKTNFILPEDEFQFLLKRKLKSKKSNKYRQKTAKCTGKISKKLPKSDIMHEKFTQYYVIEYRPKSPYNAYIIDKYFLNKSII